MLTSPLTSPIRPLLFLVSILAGLLLLVLYCTHVVEVYCTEQCHYYFIL